ncbi:DUF981 family protein [Rubrivirga litoralis]|uniref:DUF981 family protein n=1 Tax=Rubrivirga litoralis TaxID=3075598 RepID=A0ABU3BSU0_9BACT|nr:DUF981 family protein [Rubrivirga sp. F394]MDT0632333.1 DUF981 family protein [Rubrivirga sp. F394]
MLLSLLLQSGDSGGLTIDWTQMPTYNTIMAVATGPGLILVVRAGRLLRSTLPERALEGYAMAFAVLGTILTATGLHMTLTWPLARYFPFDNIVFGEPSLAFGVLLLWVAFYAWTRGPRLLAEADPGAAFTEVLRPVSVFVFGMGLGLFGIAAAGVGYQLFAAPPEEPIAGWFAAYPWIEATFISGLYALVGLGAVLLPWSFREGVRRVVGTAWTVAGVVFLLFGALNFFTHIGLIVNTMPHAP